MNDLVQHKSTCILLTVVITFLTCWPVQAFAVDVKLAWDACTWPDLAGYKVYYGTASKAYNTSINVQDITSYTVTGLDSKTYYFAVTAYDSAGVETAFSNEVSTGAGDCGKDCSANGSGSANINDPTSTGLIQIIPHVVESTELRSNLGINNVSDGFATVTVRLINKDGTEVAAQPFTIPPRGLSQVNRVVRELRGTSDAEAFEGYLVLESNLPIGAWVSEIDNATNDPGFVIVKTKGLAHQLVGSTSNLGVFRSTLVVVNTGEQIATVTITMRNVDGRIQGELKDLKIPVHGVYSTPNILESLGVFDNFGPLEILSTNGQPLVVTSRVYTSSGTSGFFNNAASANLIEIVPHVVESAETRSNLGINNVSDGFATVTVRLINKDGTEVAAKPFTIPPRGLRQVNRVVSELRGSGDGMPFEGYLLLESNLSIGAWVSEINNDTNDPGLLVSKSQGFAHLLIGSTANLGIFRSTLVVVNTGEQVATVTITMRDVDGQIRGELKDLKIPAHGFYSTPNILESLGVSDDFGPLEVLSTNGQPLVVTSRVYTSSGTSGFLEGQPLE